MTRVDGVELVLVKRLAFAGARIHNRKIYWREDIPLSVSGVAHELRHVWDRHRLGWRFLGWYLLGWLCAGLSYRGNRFEELAREAEDDPFFLAWAIDVIDAHFQGRGASGRSVVQVVVT